MDIPAMDVNVEQIFIDNNVPSAYYDTISPALLGEDGIVRTTKDGKIFKVELPDELKLRGNAGRAYDALKKSSISRTAVIPFLKIYWNTKD